MGCDIHVYAEEKRGNRFVQVSLPSGFMDYRSYGVFGFLANVRNYSAVTPISEPRGFPEDASRTVRETFDDWGGDAHTPSWLSLKELIDFDYDQPMEDRRESRQIAPGLYSGAETAEPGQGKPMTYRQFLGKKFFDYLDKLKNSAHPPDRLVFWFDN